MTAPLTMVGCGSSEPADTTSKSTTPATTVLPDPTPSPTTLAPQTTSAVPEIIELAFDGSVCTTTGPTVVPASVHSFVVKGLTGNSPADMRTMAITDGHTYQDLLDLQSQPGEYVPLPEWAKWPLTTFDPVDRELGDNELGKRLIPEPGEHGITVRTDEGLWFCGALVVTES
ncbi:MAG: hypothetical protein QNL26_02565 [Acidimicrobiia bacterium]|nr:hypothetical protein [Acidimicrobiia bacterium]